MSAGSEIAIIGMAGRFPGAGDINAFWNNLEHGVESVHFFTKEELIAAGEDEIKLEDESYIPANALVSEKEYFDSEFFGYLPAEVNVMDPQLRLFHEECWKAMEDAGYNITKTGHRVGLFAGAASNVSWEVYAALLNMNGQVDNFTASQLRNARYLNTKISYALNLTGPSVFIDTACSTSLVAIHQACNSLLLGECTMALAGGVSLGGHSKRGYVYQEGMINSKDGHCRAFDAAASGTIIGEGAAVVVLKKLKDAVKDRDHIYAVIKGTCVNNDGNDKVGFTAPSIEGQSTVIRTAQKWARVEPESISYVEAHGTGTTLGDPVEVAGLIRAFNTSKKQFCAIGSVKTNIGHLDAAAGVAGLIKTALSLKHRRLPPSLHFTEPNPKIDFANSPFYVNAKLQDWKNEGHLLRAGVSSFGIGGTNAHAVVEEAPLVPTGSGSRDYQLLLFSAKTPWSLQKNMEKFENFLRHNESEPLADIAYTLQTGRVSFSCRQAVICHTQDEAVELLPGLQQPATFTRSSSRQSPQVVFMFSGQGSQYANMCRDLYENEAFFKKQVDDCCRFIKEKYNKDILAVIFPGEETAVTAIDRTEFTQPALFIIEYALAQLLLSWGIQPAYMIGHSIGEYVAACISGVFSLDDALTLVTKRGELMQQAAPGKMLSVSAGEKEVLDLLAAWPQLSLAAVNSPGLCTISGDTESIELFSQQAQQANYICRPVRTSHAFHSAMMDELLHNYKQVVAAVELASPQLPFLSNLTGTFITAELATDPNYWVNHLRHTVKFSAGIESILAQNNNSIFVEVGPGKVLYSLVSAQQTTQPVIHMTRHSKDGGSDVYHLLQALGGLWCNGVAISWNAFYADEQRNRVSLPAYSFERTRYIADVDINKLVQQHQGAGYHRSITESMHVSGWQRSLSPGMDMEAGEQAGITLIVPGKEAFSVAIAGQLKPHHQQVIVAQSGEAFLVVNENTWKVDYADWNAVWQHCSKEGIRIAHIIYCATLEEQPSPVDYAHIGKTINSGYIGLCELAKSLAGIKQENKIHITVVSNHSVQVFEEDIINPLKSCILAPVKIITVELLHINCKLLDIPYPFQQQEQQLKYATAVVNELGYESEPVVAYRAGQRWTPSFGIAEHNRKIQSGIAIENGGVYIITGGFGGMGLTLAANLLTGYKCTVILVQRSAFPQRKDWLQWVAEKGSDDATSKRITSLLAMEQNGGRVEVLQANVGIEEEVRLVCEYIQRQYAKINGVIWAAGEVDFGGIIQQRSYDGFTKYLTSKVHGVLLFHKYLDFKQLDFLSLFSSVGNIFYESKFGQVAYNAANEFMEAFAYYARAAFGIHAIVINWCDWLSVGMTVKTEQRRAAGADIKSINAKIEGGIYPQEGITAFHACLNSKAVGTVIYKGNLTEAIRGSRAAYQQQLAQMTAVVPSTEDKTERPEEKLLQLFRNFFGRNNLSPDDDFFEQGGDSLKAMTLIARINQTMGCALLIADLYNNPTAAELSAYINRQSGTTSGSLIPKAVIKPQYVLSAAQKRMYFLQQVNKSRTVYNEFQLVKLNGKLDVQQIENTFNRLIQRHESLRTGFTFTEDGPVQVISDTATIQLEQFQATNDSEAGDIVNRFIRPFDLAQPPLLRAGLIHFPGEEYLLLVDMHHIITDGVSKKILIKDFMLLYRQQELPPLSLQYKDYAEWQHSPAQQEKVALQKSFWLNEFADEVAPLDLPADYSRPQEKDESGDYVNFDLSEQQTAALRAIATAQGASIFMVLMAVYNIVLSKLSNKEDIVIGIPAAGRRHADLEEIIGVFVNTLPVRNAVKGQMRFSDFVAAVKSKMLLALDNQDYQYEELIEVLKVTRDTSRNPLFDVMLAYQKHEESSFNLPGLAIAPYENRDKKSKFDLSLLAWEYPATLQLSFEYSTALFKPETVQRFAAYLQQVVNAVTLDPNCTLGSIDILTEKEKQQLLHQFNDTKAGYPANKTIIDVFEAQVKKTPDNVAVIFDGHSISYRQLHEQSGKIAAYLQEQGVKPGHLVGLMLPRSSYLIPAVFGILKAGAAYVPVDPQFPTARIQSIIEDAGLKTLLTTTAYIQLPALAGLTVTDLQDKWDLIQQRPFAAIPPLAQPNGLAYVIYTSGSTGKPKGVMIEHHSVLNRLGWMQKQYPITEKDVLLQKTPVVFDVSVWELFWWSFNGASLCVLKPNAEKEPGEIIAAIEKHKVTTIHFVPSMLAAFLAAQDNSFDYRRLSALKQVFASGEALKPSTVAVFGETMHKISGTRLINLYGPTEATVDVSYYECRFPGTHTSVPIGKPIDNITLHILDKDNQLMPVGSLGELCIAGVGLARGYLNNEPLTNEKFFYPSCLQGERVYRTGDLAKWMPDGNIEYAGRIDHQVKIRGYRIETGEIEFQLARHAHINESVVIIKEKDGAKYLVAYYVAAQALEPSMLKSFLLQQLPDYMVPSFFVQLEKLPVTINGKLDRKALPDPKTGAGQYVAPSGELEEKLAAIWAEVLKADRNNISVNVNFFDIGGDSIKVLLLVGLINKTLQVQLSVPEIFRHPSISSLVSLLKEGEADTKKYKQQLQHEVLEMNEAISLLNNN